MNYQKVLINKGFKQMLKDFDGSNIDSNLEKWYLYINYVLVIVKDKKAFCLLDYDEYLYNKYDFSNLTTNNYFLHDINYITKYRNPFVYLYGITDDKLEKWKSEYREYILNKIL